MTWHPFMSRREIEDYYEHDLVGEVGEPEPDEEELETTGKPPECNAPGGGPSGPPVNGESERVVGVVPSVVGDR